MSEYKDDSLSGIAPDLADARDAWWQNWEDANLDENNRSTLGYDIEQGWDAAWDCIEQAIAAHDADVRKAALAEAAQIAEQDLCALVGCGNPKCTQSRATAAAIRAAALGDAPTGGE